MTKWEKVDPKDLEEFQREMTEHVIPEVEATLQARADAIAGNSVAGRIIAQLKNNLGTEQTMHAAWRKRAEEAEKELAEIRNELTCCDDVKLDQSSVGIIASLDFDRQMARAELRELTASRERIRNICENSNPTYHRRIEQVLAELETK